MYGQRYDHNRGGSGGNRPPHNEEQARRKNADDVRYFQLCIDQRSKGTFNQRRLTPAQEEKLLFGGIRESTTEDGVISDNIPVERSGARATEVPVLLSFNELEGTIPPFMTQCIKLMKYTNPTPIQKHAIPLGMAEVDLMCCAQTGSGKTFSFLMPVVYAIHRDTMASSEQRVSIDTRGAMPKAVVLAPTRELASQIHMDARRLLFTSPFRSVCVYGGNDIKTQLQELSGGIDLVVATPGRLSDLLAKRCVSLCQVSCLVLDEADRMLDMGFEPQIRNIVLDCDMPAAGSRQTFLFSATFPEEIQKLATEFLHNYVWIGVGRVGSTVGNIRQQIIRASSDPYEKMRLLVAAIAQTKGRTLVFVQRKRTASFVTDVLRQQFHGKAEEIHGDRSQAQREAALREFRDGRIQILVATDVAARGLDVPEVTHVIQFDLPISSDDFDVYIHRIGRTGRAGKQGMATALYVPGREVGEGNGKIAGKILELLNENNQEVPEWFASCDDLRVGAYRNTDRPAQYSKYSSRVQQQPHNPYRDYRGSEHMFTYPPAQHALPQQVGYGYPVSPYQQYQGYQQGYQQDYYPQQQRPGFGGRFPGASGYTGAGRGYSHPDGQQRLGGYNPVQAVTPPGYYDPSFLNYLAGQSKQVPPPSGDFADQFSAMSLQPDQGHFEASGSTRSALNRGPAQPNRPVASAFPQQAGIFGYQQPRQQIPGQYTEQQAYDAARPYIGQFDPTADSYTGENGLEES